jgi:tellurite resistance protein TerC
MEFLPHAWWMWIGFLFLVIVLLSLDLGVLHKGNKEVSFKGALLSVSLYFLLACIFCFSIYEFMGVQPAKEFAMGYLIELTLSVDNVFVFALIFTHFAVPKEYRYRVLFWGVLGAIVMRFAFIVAGTALIKSFDWLIYVFGAFLLITGFKMIKAASSEPDISNNFILRFARKNFRITKDYVGSKFFVKEQNILYVTPLFIVLLLVEFTDVIFAVDSIPAIFAVTLDPFIVFTSNIFAILGLRSMYFVLENVIQRFKYLKYGLSVLLVFIGFKMIVNHAFAPNKIVPTDISLLITVLIIGFSIFYSLLKTKNKN